MKKYMLFRLFPFVLLLTLFVALWLPSLGSPDATQLNEPPQWREGDAAANSAPALPDVYLGGGGDQFSYLPVLQNPTNPNEVNVYDRASSQNFYLQTYMASEGVNPEWTGNHASCNPGTTSQAFRDAITLRINYFRQMAGVPPITGLSPIYTQKAQQAALMMSVNNALSHTPPNTWLCWTADGSQAAGSSNLYLGVYGPSAITGYINDPGGGNYAVGHRRWVLFPPTEMMGTGDIPPTGGYFSSNALWVFDIFSPIPPTREAYVAWPPPGYTPYQVVFPRWSFSYSGADFSSATVTMSSGGSIPTNVQPVVNGYGLNTLVWEPSITVGAGPDKTYTVNVNGVLINGSPQNFSYDVIVFDPNN